MRIKMICLFYFNIFLLTTMNPLISQSKFHRGDRYFIPPAIESKADTYLIKSDLQLLWSQQQNILSASPHESKATSTKSKKNIVWTPVGIGIGTIAGFASSHDSLHPLTGAFIGGLIGLGIDFFEWLIFH